MPGHIIHLAVASSVLKQVAMDTDATNAFLLGTIAPDMFRGSDKKSSHFWTDAMLNQLDRVPDLDAFVKKYKKDFSNPFVLGYYGHIYMDTMFMHRYWAKHFSFYDKDMNVNNQYDEVAYIKVTDDEDGQISEHLYPREEFLSDDYYYGDYDRINPYIIKKYDVILPNIERLEVMDAVPEAMLDDRKDCLTKMIEAAKGFQKQSKDATFDDTKKILKVFKLEEIEHLIADSVNEIIKCI